MKQDGFDLAVARAERAFSKLVRIREGIEEVGPEDALGVTRWRPGRASLVQRTKGQSQDRPIEFNRPVTRSYRLTSAAGATSFHIQHRAIGKVTYEMNEDGLRNRPGAARAHSRYVERDVAVALIEPEAGVDPATAIVVSAVVIDARPDADITNALTNPIINLETDNEHDWRRLLGLDLGIARGLVDDLAGPQPGAPGYLEYGAGEDAEADAGLWLLSRRDLVRQGRGSHGHLPGAQHLSVESGTPFTDCQMRRRFLEARAKSEEA